MTETASPTTQASFQTLVETYKRPIYFLARDLTGNHHDAEDLSQEVFIKAYRKLDTFRGDASMKSWLCRITVNTYLNTKRKKALRFMTLWDSFSEQDHGRGGLPRTDAATEARTMNAHLERAIEQLSPRERTAFILRHHQDMAVKEVAAAMNVAEGTVKSTLFRAVRKLQATLAFYRDDLGLKEGTDR